MKDLRIVIVSWNVQEYLARCLASLPAACEGLDWECVVVDNASSDKSVEIARHVGAQFIAPSRHAGGHDGRKGVMNHAPTVIVNAANYGFAKACNIGAAELNARYVLFLNPDTECPPGSLQKFVALADAQPKAGILGPKITNPDGTFQESIRRFPTVWSQVGVLLKLHHIFPWFKTFRSYFAKDLDASTAQAVDQVMGACFLVRKELIDQKLGFDERYFLWFEEVDFCKTAIQKGWEVRYEPSVSIIHARGKSFAQAITVTKQRYLDRSLKKYFQKWHPGWQPRLIALAHPIAMFQAYVLGALRTPYGKWACLVVGIEILSLLTIFTTSWNSLAVCAVALVVGILAWKRPTIALGAVLLELLIGSKGYLLQFGGWPSNISLRMMMTGAFCLGWYINIVQQGAQQSLMKRLQDQVGYIALFALVLFAYLRGMFLGNLLVLQDANGWLEWVLLIPVLDIAWRYRATIRKDIVPVLWVGIGWVAAKTLLLEYIFSHGFANISLPLYLWVRRTGVGEVTPVVANAFRIFFQSHVYAVVAWVFSLSWFLTTPRQAGERSKLKTGWWMIVVSTFILAVSLSRSFFVGAVMGTVVVVGLLWKNHAIKWSRIFGVVTAKFVALCTLFIVLAFPLPPVDVASIAELFSSRANMSEAAVQSRWNLLPILYQKGMEHPILGSGFGATVTYASKDPRVLSEHPDGMYTTYAFEWGWVEHWIKFGIVGIPLIAYLLFSLMFRIWKLDEPLWLRTGAVASLVALAALHFFTPYLNHPLGFVFFFVGEGFILSSVKNHL